MENCSKHGPYSVLCRMCDLETVAAYEKAERETLRALVREVFEDTDDCVGSDGAARALALFSRLAESGWFKRARAALTS